MKTHWLVAWGYKPEFYQDQPLTVTDLDPITGKHLTLIENASMHIWYVNSLVLDKDKITAADNIPGVIIKTGKNGLANMTYPQIEEWVCKVHAAGLQAMIHTNGDHATEWAIRAIEKALAAQPRIDHRHHLDHNQMVNDNQLQRVATQGIATNPFINHVYYWGDLHREIIGPRVVATMVGGKVLPVTYQPVH